MRPTRGNAILITVAVGVVFLVGLVVHGPVGGVLLLLVAATLVLFSRDAWPHLRRDSQMMRVAVVVLVLLIAVLKLLGRT